MGQSLEKTNCMNKIVTIVGIDDPNNPINEERGPFCPFHELTYIDTEPLNPEKVPLTKVVNATVRAGTYGMGGPGFFALDFESGERLLMTLWGAEDWLTLNGVLISKMQTHLAFRFRKKTLNNVVVGQSIRAFQIRKHSFWMLLSDSIELEITEEVGERDRNRMLEQDEDLRRAFVVLPKVYTIWV